jgi:SAM-dependent methyltransferase
LPIERKDTLGNPGEPTDSSHSIGYENRFGPAVEAFRSFRPGYPSEVFEQILAEVPADQRHRAVDLGSGTGLSALPLCRWFREVMAVEPDPQMAADLVEKNDRLVVRNLTAEEFDLPAGSVDLVTCGTAFHWMNGPLVLAKSREWLRPSGVLALYNYPVPKLSPAVQAVAEREFALHWGNFRHPRLDDPDYVGRTFLEHSGLLNLRIRKIPNVVYFSPEEAVGFCRSTSYGSAYMRTLADPEPYLRDLLREFQRASEGRPIAADFEITLCLGRKPEAVA